MAPGYALVHRNEILHRRRRKLLITIVTDGLCLAHLEFGDEIHLTTTGSRGTCTLSSHSYRHPNACAFGHLADLADFAEALAEQVEEEEGCDSDVACLLSVP